jgi:hypothetical protein
MFEKEIQFIAHEKYVDYSKENYPVPIKINIPEWFKKLDHSVDSKTVKGCMPFLDTLTSGYLLKLGQDYRIQHNIKNIDTQKRYSLLTPALSTDSNADETLLKMNVHARAHPLDAHPIFQISGSSLLEKNKFLPVNKFYNPWIIKTPPGYSCLFVSPLNNADDRFSIISAIVDTDTYTQYINFPFIVNGDKYPELDTIVKKGTPYVQVIPFKRDNWRMKVKKITEKMKDESRFFQDLIINVYKNKFWSKKSWK